MNTVAILQARMSSSRLPGKVLAPILGEPMIGRQIERIRRATSLERVVVATSTETADDELVDYVHGLGVQVVRGSLTDVLGRFLQAVEGLEVDAVVRLTADCPLASPVVIDRVVSEFVSSDCDYVSNTLVPSFPDGLDAEVVRVEALRWVAANSTDPHEREHVTLGVYRRPERFSLLNVTGSSDFSDLRWTVDNSDDLEFVRSVYSRLYLENPEFEFEDVLSLLRAEPSLSRTNRDAGRNVALDGLDTGAMER